MSACFSRQLVYIGCSRCSCQFATVDHCPAEIGKTLISKSYRYRIYLPTVHFIHSQPDVGRIGIRLITRHQMKNGARRMAASWWPGFNAQFSQPKPSPNLHSLPLFHIGQLMVARRRACMMPPESITHGLSARSQPTWQISLFIRPFGSAAGI